ncbi:MAG: polymerase subunit delta [Thermoleophilaceae bacterium]|nr:polymerase subunit delta [Thermoleophilaceae bacterium]
MTVALPGTEEHPHARMVLGAALAAGEPSHAYLFHGPPGTGKRTAARALAAELLAAGEPDSDAARRRVRAGTHPDLTWVKPTGAHVMRVSDVEEPVVSAATRTPFESSKRVFVLERADTMNDEVANRLLKTLEEPAEFVHLILLTDALGQVLETVVSRCQLVRFDPLSPERIAAVLEEEGVEAARAGACGRLALGNLTRARFLASEEGEALRADVERLVRACLAGEMREAGGEEPWRPLLTRADARCDVALEEVARAARDRLENEPKGRDRKAMEREFEETAKRDGRRARTEVLELGLELMALSFRDLLCLAEGAPGAVLASDRAESLAGAARGRDARRLREAIERCEDARQALELNVTEDLALTALTLRLERLVGSAD